MINGLFNSLENNLLILQIATNWWKFYHITMMSLYQLLLHGNTSPSWKIKSVIMTVFKCGKIDTDPA